MHWRVCIGVSSPPPHLKTPSALFFANPLSLSEICKLSKCLPFLGNSPLYIGFLWSPCKNQIFQWTPIILKFFILNPIPSFKSIAKFLVKISLFKILVLTEKNIFVYKLFCHWIFQILVYLLCKNCNTSEKVYPFFSVTPSINWDPFKLLYLKRLNPTAESGGCTLCNCLFVWPW